MATILRTWSYQYPWLYDTISALAAITVGGSDRLHRLAWQDLDLPRSAVVLDLCCAHGVVTQALTQAFDQVTGLDASPKAIARARQRVPQATYVEAFAEKMPFADATFDLVHTSMALHEMTAEQLRAIVAEVWRVLKPGGWFALIDFHRPQVPLFWPGMALFFWLFETETAWQLLQTDLAEQLRLQGFTVERQTYHLGRSLQVLHARKPCPKN
ncbi:MULTISPECIES: class I SAM-dependent methyltransferase [unclassified Thermosynechococcus]|uniref:class I SAM-dependent methyltransferase n=1 Tax=unclassified Thermosynechococcus TaxID=2622553 RepID=UPI0019810592|nr:MULTISPECIES: methyltransferase domain-containing protein [unclassified Thermosynechococcus]MDR5637964.1 methyltransferase domain-containing protein [Thermosynechococcus sp. PP42]QSF49378.1 class I SAM-dependent methyltransferase [Thermosynechococcus sp. TA-1]WKT81400.1 methyltransferase domain-containing protein [Thermosynechococcus sp. PP45]WNC25012.1 methyltransferase domain-containing protein [Thermosynechococcus sp. PP551]WNC27589.1 methyltransferase domain-containing protein [Thermosy